MAENMNTREKGYAAEDAAAEFLINKGYSIRKRNFHFGRHGEIDIIAQDKQTIVFVEVKSRITDKFSDPLESITYGKQVKLRKTAEGFLYVNKISGMECRFDVITVDYSKDRDNPQILHLINAM